MTVLIKYIKFQRTEDEFYYSDEQHSCNKMQFISLMKQKYWSLEILAERAMCKSSAGGNLDISGLFSNATIPGCTLSIAININRDVAENVTSEQKRKGISCCKMIMISNF